MQQLGFARFCATPKFQMENKNLLIKNYFISTVVTFLHVELQRNLPTIFQYYTLKKQT